MTRIQLETGFIDLPIGTDFPIDLSFAEITKSGARTGGASRSLEVDGTENNTTILGALFDIDLSNDTFNRNKKTIASVIQNGVEVFDGSFFRCDALRRFCHASSPTKAMLNTMSAALPGRSVYPATRMASKDVAWRAFHRWGNDLAADASTRQDSSYSSVAPARTGCPESSAK